jgi:steroid delta-isomerase
MRRIAPVIWVLASCLFGAAEAETPEAEIRAQLEQWTADFNARDERRICDLFSRALRYDYRGFPERDYDSLCTLLRRSLADPDKRYRYQLQIKEILVSGELAAVRLTWRLTVTGAGAAPGAQSVEPGLDLFRKEADGRWRIVRYIAYEE